MTYGFGTGITEHLGDQKFHLTLWAEIPLLNKSKAISGRKKRRRKIFSGLSRSRLAFRGMGMSEVLLAGEKGKKRHSREVEGAKQGFHLSSAPA